MLRSPADAAEQATALARLNEAHGLMAQALEMLDGTAVATNCDAHLDQAMHSLSDAIDDVAAGKPIFTAPRARVLVDAGIGRGDERLDRDDLSTPWE